MSNAPARCPLFGTSRPPWALVCSSWIAGLVLVALALSPRTALAQAGPPPISSAGAANAPPPDLAGVGIDPKPGAELPRDAALTGSDGRSFVLGEYADREKPLILVLAYYRCPMLCSLVLSGV